MEVQACMTILLTIALMFCIETAHGIAPLSCPRGPAGPREPGCYGYVYRYDRDPCDDPIVGIVEPPHDYTGHLSYPRGPPCPQPPSCSAAASDTYRCYDEDFRRGQCCCFCKKRQTNIVGCEFGDKKTSCAADTRNPRQCYRYEDDCCASCTKVEETIKNQFENVKLQDCKYGDREDCSRIRASECYDGNMRKRCCAKCETLKLNNPPKGCEWGDRLQNCNCERESDARDPRCCYSCGTQPLVIDNTCNDTASWCRDIAAKPWLCYRGGDRACCRSCALQENRIRAQLSSVLPSCKYGDKASWCTDPSSGMRRRKSRCYSKYNNENCCLSCHQLREDVPGCEYGDKWGSCQTMRTSECYYRPREEACCERCPEVKENMKKAGLDVSRCPYGDRVSWCAERYCAREAERCCATCANYTSSEGPRPRGPGGPGGPGGP